MLTGEARIHCEDYRQELTKGLNDRGDPVIGGEMEGGGLVASGPKDAPSWIVVKGISDFADHNRDTVIQTSRLPASENAARFVLEALKWEASVNGTV